MGLVRLCPCLVVRQLLFLDEATQGYALRDPTLSTLSKILILEMEIPVHKPSFLLLKVFMKSLNYVYIETTSDMDDMFINIAV